MADRIIFVSGHLDLTLAEFQEHYAPKLAEAVKDPESKFVVGDARGADTMTQEFLSQHVAPERVQVFHMLERPRNLAIKASTVGGFENDQERDIAMTLASTEDLGWIRPNRTRSGTAHNLERRKHAEYYAKERLIEDRRTERRSWQRFQVGETEVFPVYSLQPVTVGAEPERLAKPLPPIPPGLYERYKAASDAYWAIQDEIEVALMEQERDPV